MAKHKRRVYGGDEAPDGNGATPCPTCGCRQRETVGRVQIGRSVRVTRACRYCGQTFVTTEQG